MNNSNNTKKPTLPTHRTLHSQKKLAEPRPAAPPCERQPLLHFIPEDEVLIEQYIHDLRLKLQQIRASPKRPPRLETEQIFKRTAQQQKTRSKPHSTEGASRGRTPPVPSPTHAASTAKKTPLLDLRQARDEFKRSKQRLPERRVATEKENLRYSEDRPVRTEAKAAQGQSCDLRMRSNTEVLRSHKNPARIYRYSSLKKAPCLEEGTVSNNFLFDRLISVHHNINIHLDERAERLRREPDEEASPQRDRQAREGRQKSPKKGEKGEKGEKVVKLEKGEGEGKIEDLSTINARKETLNFLGESCLALRDQLQPKEEKEVSKILDMLGWKTNEMREALSNLKQKRRKNGLEKLGKIFPKGFFP